MRLRNPFRWRHAAGGAITFRSQEHRDEVAVRLSPAEVWMDRSSFELIGGLDALHQMHGADVIVHLADDDDRLDVTVHNTRDPWDACLDVDPFTGQPDGCGHGDACPGDCD